MTDMTPEQLDTARHEEALHRYRTADTYVTPYQNYRELVRTDWRPADPDLLAVREICAQRMRARGAVHEANACERGECDHLISFGDCLANYKAGKAAR